MRLIPLIYLLLFSTPLLAATVSVKVVEAIKGKTFDLGIGSKVLLTYSDKKKVESSVFLGRMVRSEEFGEEFLFLDVEKTRIYMVDSKSVRLPMAKTRAQAIIAPVDQAGDTCAAYAIYHFWQQTYEVGFVSAPLLKETMTSERGRMKFLEMAISNYYLSEAHDNQKALKKDAVNFGFKCKEYLFKKSQDAIDYVYETTLRGNPVIMEFNIGASGMLSSSYEVVDYETRLRRDTRLWIPRLVGERNQSGHAIVAAGAFTVKGRKKVLVLDSNWTEPRVWDLQKYLSKKTSIQTMIFHSCD